MCSMNNHSFIDRCFMYICLCKAITDSQIRDAVNNGKATSMKALNEQLGIATQCGKCGREAKRILKQSFQQLCQTATFINAG